MQFGTFWFYFEHVFKHCIFPEKLVIKGTNFCVQTIINELYEKFPHLYRERTAPLESSRMGWGFQCEDGWYKIIYEILDKNDYPSPS